jgi:CRISPR-associated protein Cmr1
VKGRYLARQDPDNSTFNQIIGREQAKGRSQRLAQETPVNRWLAGRQQESKKVFSFKHPEEGRRTFGFVKPGLVEFDEMKRRLGQVWSPFNPDAEFITKDQILSELFSQGGNV